MIWNNTAKARDIYTEKKRSVCMSVLVLKYVESVGLKEYIMLDRAHYVKEREKADIKKINVCLFHIHTHM